MILMMMPLTSSYPTTTRLFVGRVDILVGKRLRISQQLPLHVSIAMTRGRTNLGELRGSGHGRHIGGVPE